ncbi:MAG: hypothetical protein MPJ22_13685, partial [Pirellulales bacterium]|nr:hypothetical protein [Pirellulales bacterium]
MNYTHVNNEGRERIIQGVTILADAVGSTLGALGNTVFIQDDNGQPLITKDGKYVSDHVVLSDPEMALGANAVKQAAAQTAHWAGDGTTTST